MRSPPSIFAPVCGVLFCTATLVHAQGTAIANPSLQELHRVMASHQELPIEVRLNGKHVLSSTLVKISGELAIPLESPIAARLRLKTGTKALEGKEFILLNDIDSAAFRYLADTTRLEIEISPEKLLPQTFAPRAAALPTIVAEPALISHYDWSVLYNSNSYSTGNTGTGISLEHVLSLGALRFNQSWAIAKTSDSSILSGSLVPRPYRRVDSFIQYDQPDKTRSWILGDQITTSQGLARSVRSFGLTVRRNFTGRPEISTRPRPSLSGYTVLPTTYELYVDSYKRGMGGLEEGLFDFASAVEGMTSGDVRLVMTDSLGRETVVVEPFFFSPAQLAANTTDYALHVGKQRNALTGKRSDYGDTIFQGEYGLGISDGWTLRASVEATPTLGVVALRSVHSLWGHGSLLADLAGSRADGVGSGKMLNLQLNGRWHSIFWGASHLRRSTSFSQIGDTAVQFNARSKQISAVSVGFKPVLSASVSLLATREQKMDNSVLTTWRPAFSYAVTRQHSVSFSANYLKDQETSSRSFFLSWSYRPSDSNININSTFNSASEQDALMVSAEQTMEKYSPFRYKVAASEYSGLFPQTSAEAVLGYRGELVDLEFDLRNRELAAYRDSQIESKGSGTVVVVKSGLFASSKAYDSSVLVKVGDMKGVRVTGATATASTNSAGYALLPSAVGLQRNRFIIEASDIPLEVDYEAAPIEVVPWPKSVVQVNTQIGQISGSSWVIERNGSHLPVATKVLVDQNEGVFVGKGGVLYLPISAEGMSIKAELPSGSVCTISFPQRPTTISRADPLVAVCD